MLVICVFAIEVLLFVISLQATVIKTAEDHESLKTGLANVRETVNSLIVSGFLIIKGKKVKVKFYSNLGGDYKVSSKSSIMLTTPVY